MFIEEQDLAKENGVQAAKDSALGFCLAGKEKQAAWPGAAGSLPAEDGPWGQAFPWMQPASTANPGPASREPAQPDYLPRCGLVC